MAENGREIARMAGRIADGKKAGDIVIYDVTGRSDLCDFIVLATVESRLQAAAITDEVYREVKTTFRETPLGREESNETQWIVMDYVSTMVHLMSSEARDFYNIEGMWGDAPVIDHREA